MESLEYFFTCPHCWEQISMLLDTSIREQTYVEDCEVCCRAIEIRYTVENDEASNFTANPVE